MFVRSPSESSQKKGFFWIFNSAAYGLVNTNAKWKVQSNHLIHDLGLLRITLIPELFYIKTSNKLTVLYAQILDDLLFEGQTADVDQVIRCFNDKCILGTIV